LLHCGHRDSFRYLFFLSHLKKRKEKSYCFLFPIFKHSGIAGKKRNTGWRTAPLHSSPTRRSVPLFGSPPGQGPREGVRPKGERGLLLSYPFAFPRATCPRGGLPTPLLEASRARPKRGGRPRRSIAVALLKVFAPGWSTQHKHPLSSGPFQSLERRKEGLAVETKAVLFPARPPD